MRSIRAQRGYTVVELAIVMVLISVLLTAGAINVRRALAREEADGWARALIGEITAGQQAAVTRRTSVTIEFEGRAFSVAVVGGGVLRQDLLPAHMTFSERRTLTFDRRGVPSGDLVVTVSSTSGRSYAITVEPGTGRVTY